MEERINERSMVKFVAFTLLTCGVYPLYFYYKLSHDVDAVCKGDGKEQGSYIMVVIFSLFTLGLYKYYWLYQLCRRLRANAPRYGFKIVDNPRDFVILDFCSRGYVSAYELIKNMNKIARVFNRSGVIAQQTVNGGAEA